MAQQTINVGSAPNDGTGDPLRTCFVKSNDNFTELYQGGGGIRTTISASDVDFSAGQVFTKTLAADTTLTFSNTSIGMVKDLIITGDFVLTLPAGSTVAGEYDGTVSNLIQVVVTNTSEYWYSISQPQT